MALRAAPAVAEAAGTLLRRQAWRRWAALAASAPRAARALPSGAGPPSAPSRPVLVGAARRLAAAAGGGGGPSPAPGAPAPAAAPATAGSTGGAVEPAAAAEVARSSPATDVDVPRPRDAPGETIQDILIRSHRDELVKKTGAQAERYLPTEDPNAFLLPDSRLEPAERRWQKVFVAVPWLVFACMVASPMLLVGGNLPFLRRRAEEENEAALGRQAVHAARRIPVFEVVNFGQMPDVLERPCPTVLLLFDARTFSSKVFLPALRDLEGVLRAAGVPVSVAALDMSAAPAPPAPFLWQYPRATAPHLQLILPRATDGEAGVVDYDGRWSGSAVAGAARSLAGPRAPVLPPEELERLDASIERLHDALVELFFVEDGPESKEPPAGWWGRLLGRGERPAVGGPGARAAAVAEAERSLDLAGGLDAAIASAEAALCAVASARGGGAP